MDSFFCCCPAKHNAVISKEKMGYLRGIRSYFDSMYKFISLSLRDHSRKDISTDNKKIGREGVSLSETPLRKKGFCRASIDKYSKRNSSNTSHDSGNEFGGEIHRGQGCFEKLPFKSVIGLSHVSLNTNKTFLARGLRKVVKHFISHNGIIRNQPARDKSTLVMTNKLRHVRFEPVSNGFSDSFEGNIT
ncbi:hypothetical protein QL285_003136 [Trifolium repens]|nr:hypothetical protein QL285_003136 [Trifolium repens]